MSIRPRRFQGGGSSGGSTPSWLDPALKGMITAPVQPENDDAPETPADIAARKAAGPDPSWQSATWDPTFRESGEPGDYLPRAKSYLPQQIEEYNTWLKRQPAFYEWQRSQFPEVRKLRHETPQEVMNAAPRIEMYFDPDLKLRDQVAPGDAMPPRPPLIPPPPIGRARGGRIRRFQSGGDTTTHKTTPGDIPPDTTGGSTSTHTTTGDTSSTPSTPSVDYFSMTPAQQQAYTNGVSPSSPNFPSSSAQIISGQLYDPVNAQAQQAPPTPIPAGGVQNPWSPTPNPYGDPNNPTYVQSTAPGQTTPTTYLSPQSYAARQFQYSTSPFMTPAAIQNQAVVGNAGLPGSLQGGNVMMPGTGATWNQLTPMQQSMYEYFINSGQQLPSNFMTAYQGPDAPWNNPSLNNLTAPSGFMVSPQTGTVVKSNTTTPAATGSPGGIANPGAFTSNAPGAGAGTGSGATGTTPASPTTPLTTTTDTGGGFAGKGSGLGYRRGGRTRRFQAGGVNPTDPATAGANLTAQDAAVPGIDPNARGPAAWMNSTMSEAHKQSLINQLARLGIQMPGGAGVAAGAGTTGGTAGGTGGGTGGGQQTPDPAGQVTQASQGQLAQNMAAQSKALLAAAAALTTGAPMTPLPPLNKTAGMARGGKVAQRPKRFQAGGANLPPWLTQNPAALGAALSNPSLAGLGPMPQAMPNPGPGSAFPTVTGTPGMTGGGVNAGMMGAGGAGGQIDRSMAGVPYQAIPGAALGPAGMEPPSKERLAAAGLPPGGTWADIAALNRAPVGGSQGMGAMAGAMPPSPGAAALGAMAGASPGMGQQNPAPGGFPAPGTSAAGMGAMAGAMPGSPGAAAMGALAGASQGSMPSFGQFGPGGQWTPPGGGPSIGPMPSMPPQQFVPPGAGAGPGTTFGSTATPGQQWGQMLLGSAPGTGLMNQAAANNPLGQQALWRNYLTQLAGGRGMTPGAMMGQAGSLTGMATGGSVPPRPDKYNSTTGERDDPRYASFYRAGASVPPEPDEHGDTLGEQNDPRYGPGSHYRVPLAGGEHEFASHPDQQWGLIADGERRYATGGRTDPSPATHATGVPMSRRKATGGRTDPLPKAHASGVPYRKATGGGVDTAPTHHASGVPIRKSPAGGQPLGTVSKFNSTKGAPGNLATTAAGRGRGFAKGGVNRTLDSTKPAPGNLATSQAGKDRFADGGKVLVPPSRAAQRARRGFSDGGAYAAGGAHEAVKPKTSRNVLRRRPAPMPHSPDRRRPTPTPPYRDQDNEDAMDQSAGLSPGVSPAAPSAAAPPPMPPGGFARGGAAPEEAGEDPREEKGESRRKEASEEKTEGKARGGKVCASCGKAHGGACKGMARGGKFVGARARQIRRAGGGKWIQDAIKKPGALRAQLGVKGGETIPAGKLAKAAKAPGKLGQRARLAQTLKGFKHARGGAAACPECGKAHGGSCKMAAGGAAKVRRGFPNTIKPTKRLARGGTVRGGGVAQRGLKFSGIY